MGFLERLRQEKLRDEQVAKRQIEQTLQGIEAQRAQEAARDQREAILREKSKGHYQDSGLASLLDELIRIKPTIKLHDFGGRETYICELKLSTSYRPKEGTSATIHTSTGFEIETTPDGTVHFKGGFFGASSVPRRLWENNRSLLEKALERAYKHPRKEEIEFTPDYGEPGMG